MLSTCRRSAGTLGQVLSLGQVILTKAAGTWHPCPHGIKNETPAYVAAVGHSRPGPRDAESIRVFQSALADQNGRRALLSELDQWVPVHHRFGVRDSRVRGQVPQAARRRRLEP